MADQSRRRNVPLTILAIAGILVELTTVVLLVSRRVAVPVGMLVLIIGLFMAMFPMVIAGRRSQA